MQQCKDVVNEIARWLKEGRPDADNLVDFPWEVEIVDEKSVRAIHPRFPIEITIFCSDDTKSIRAVILTNIPTINLDNKDRVMIYRKLLRLNNIPVAKTLLYGDEDYIGVASDMSIHSLGKKEFNDALAFLIALLISVARETGFEEELYKRLIEELSRLVSKHFEEGWSREKLVKYLVETVGMNPSDAEDFLESIGIKAKDIISRIRESMSM
ncbi:hypothetical protein J4526_05295 [Desulfurococcaceae archaeon MEX13E-LK6-19]|nr:hypothetical protein J4526_05295 [Desulfurococcaceae archaeon MEX13E-LK6-19]